MVRIKRDPGIHITKSRFIEIWKSLSNTPLPKEFLDSFFKKARENTQDNRSLYISNKKQQDKASSRIRSSISDANLLADIIYSNRVKLKHIGVTKIKQNEPQWIQIKELVPIINNFCSTHRFQKRKGYLEFIEIGFKLLSQTNRPNYQYCSSWFIKNASTIISYYDSLKSLNGDNNPVGTREIYGIYTNKVLEMVGVSNNYKSQPDKYIYFLRAREMADNIGVDYEDFINAQFEALEFCNGIPNIEDLSNEKANQRLVRYLSNHNLNINYQKPTLVENFDWDDFKK